MYTKTSLLMICVLQLTNGECNPPGRSLGYRTTPGTQLLDTGIELARQDFECQDISNQSSWKSVSSFYHRLTTNKLSKYCINGRWVPKSMSCVKEFDPPPLESIQMYAGEVEVDFVHDGKSACLNIEDNVTNVVLRLSRRMLIKVVSVAHYRRDPIMSLGMPGNLSLGTRRTCINLNHEPAFDYVTFSRSGFGLISNYLNQTKHSDDKNNSQIMTFNCESNEDISVNEGKVNEVIDPYFVQVINITLQPSTIIQICELYISSPDPFACDLKSLGIPLNGFVRNSNNFSDYQQSRDNLISSRMNELYYNITGHILSNESLAFSNIYGCNEGFDKYYTTERGQLVIQNTTNPDDIYLCGPEGTFIGREYICKPKAPCPLFDIEQLGKHNLALINGDNSDIVWPLTKYVSNYRLLTYFDGQPIAQVGTEAEFGCFSELANKYKPGFGDLFLHLETEVSSIVTNDIFFQSRYHVNHVNQSIAEKDKFGSDIVSMYSRNAFMNGTLLAGVFRFGLLDSNGFRLIGASKLICTSKGWSGPLPRCETVFTWSVLQIIGGFLALILVFVIQVVVMRLKCFKSKPIHRQPIQPPAESLLNGDVENDSSSFNDEHIYSLVDLNRNDVDDRYMAVIDEPYDDNMLLLNS